MNADGSRQRRLPACIYGWALDGRIAYSGDRQNDEVYVANSDWSGARNLTRNPARDHQATWSPDGRMIAFTSDRDGNPEIYVLNADGSELRNLTNWHGEDADATCPDLAAEHDLPQGAEDPVPAPMNGVRQSNRGAPPTAEAGPQVRPRCAGGEVGLVSAAAQRRRQPSTA